MLTYNPVEGGVVGSYVDGFFDSSCKVVPLLAYSAKLPNIFYVNSMCLM